LVFDYQTTWFHISEDRTVTYLLFVIISLWTQ